MCAPRNSCCARCSASTPSRWWSVARWAPSRPGSGRCVSRRRCCGPHRSPAPHRTQIGRASGRERGENTEGETQEQKQDRQKKNQKKAEDTHTERQDKRAATQE